MTPNGPPSGGWVTRSTVSLKRGSFMSCLAMRNMPFATSAAIASAGAVANAIVAAQARANDAADMYRNHMRGRMPQSVQYGQHATWGDPPLGMQERRETSMFPFHHSGISIKEFVAQK